jgi:hypothetical protein
MFKVHRISQLYPRGWADRRKGWASAPTAKKGLTRSLDGELLLLATPSARLTSSNTRRHARATSGRSRTKVRPSRPRPVHRSLHGPPHGPFFAYIRSSPPLPYIGLLDSQHFWRFLLAATSRKTPRQAFLGKSACCGGEGKDYRSSLEERNCRTTSSLRKMDVEI